MSDERARAWTVERPGSVTGGPDGPIPVQPGDIVIVHVVKSWSDLARVYQEAKRDPR
jgi:hypothetical protein